MNLPPHTTYWKDAPRKSMGDPTPENIFLQVGQSLTGWELVEIIFGKLFGTFVGGNSVGSAMQAAEAAYGVIASNNTRRDMLEHAAAIFFTFNVRDDEKLRADWKALVKHYQEASMVRNNIAHGVASHYQLNNESRGYFLEPAWYNSKKRSTTTLELHEATGTQHFKAAYRYVASDIQEYGVKFTAFRQAVQDFHMELSVKIAAQWAKEKPPAPQ